MANRTRFQPTPSERRAVDPACEHDVVADALTQELSADAWQALARRLSWQTLSQHLNVMARRDVFASAKTVAVVAHKLSDAEEVRTANATPYRLLTVYKNLDAAVPGTVRCALRDACEVALYNVPAGLGGVLVAPDVSAPMLQPVTQARASRVRCVDVAGLVVAALLRANNEAAVLPFDRVVRPFRGVGTDSIFDVTQRLGALCGGSANVAAPLAEANAAGLRQRVVIIVSNTRMWADRASDPATPVMAQWTQHCVRVPDARLVLLDVGGETAAPVRVRPDVLRIVGFSDHTFDVVQRFTNPHDRSVERVAHIDVPTLQEES